MVPPSSGLTHAAWRCVAKGRWSLAAHWRTSTTKWPSLIWTPRRWNKDRGRWAPFFFASRRGTHPAPGAPRFVFQCNFLFTLYSRLVEQDGCVSKSICSFTWCLFPIYQSKLVMRKQITSKLDDFYLYLKLSNKISSKMFFLTFVSIV